MIFDIDILMDGETTIKIGEEEYKIVGISTKGLEIEPNSLMLMKKPKQKKLHGITINYEDGSSRFINEFQIEGCSINNKTVINLPFFLEI